MSPADGPWPAGLEERVELYLTALVTAPPSSDALLAEVRRRLDGPPDDASAFAVAHDVVGEHARVAPDLEAYVLGEELGVSPPIVASILGWSQADVVALLDEIRASLGSLDTGRPSAPPTGDLADAQDVHPEPPRPPVAPAGRVASGAGGTGSVRGTAGAPGPDRQPPPPVGRRTRVIVGVLLAVAAVAVALAIGALREDPGDRCAAPSVTCVLELRIVDSVGLDGVPGPDRSRLTTTDDVIAWFRVRPQPRADEVLDFAWFRDGEQLYESAFRLGQGESVHVSLAERFSDEPGTYRIEIRADGEVLAADDVELVAP